jgi:thioester reductase-like protein
MKVLLTGITGNLGHEVMIDLTSRGHIIVPIVRSNTRQTIFGLSRHFEEVVHSDLLGTDDIQFTGTADCIVHCAGIVHFQKAASSNEQMIDKVITLAKRLKIPIYFVSTAFVYRPQRMERHLNNSYEEDKWRAEERLVQSGIRHGIFRPSILVGNSKTGEIQNFNGYYLVIKAFVSALRNSKQRGQKMRFPKLLGKANMIPVDQAAQSMGVAIENGRLETLFVSNPNPPTAEWSLVKALEFFGVSDQIEFLDCSFEEYGKLDLTEAEKKMYQFGAHFEPYWSLAYDFPETVCTSNLISGEYLTKTLTYFRQSSAFSNAQADY